MGSSVILPQPGQPRTGPDPTFKSAAIPNIVSFGFTEIDPPAALYIQRDDVLVLEVITNFINNELTTISGRILLPYATAAGQPDAPTTTGSAAPQPGPGYIQPFQTTVAASSGAVAVAQIIAGQEGYLLSVVVTSLQGLRRGDVFVRVWLNRAVLQTTQPNAFALLLADYVTKTAPVTWPGGRVLSPADGPGKISLLIPANPGAGADFSIQANNAGRSRLQSVKATLVTSATVANRFPSFLLKDASGSVHYQVQDTAAVPASTTVTYSLAPGGTNVRGGGAPIFVTLPVPSPFFVALNSPMTVQSSTQGLQVGDQWSTTVIVTEDWLDAF